MVLVAVGVVAVFGSGLGCGYGLYRRAYRDGVRLRDRLANNQEPFEPDFTEKQIQVTTGGEFEDIE